MTVISLVALMTMLIVAMLSISQTELKSAQVSADDQHARQLSEVAVNLVISQLRKVLFPLEMVAAGSICCSSNGWKTSPISLKKTLEKMGSQVLVPEGVIISNDPGWSSLRALEAQTESAPEGD